MAPLCVHNLDRKLISPEVYDCFGGLCVICSTTDMRDPLSPHRDPARIVDVEEPECFSLDGLAKMAVVFGTSVYKKTLLSAILAKEIAFADSGQVALKSALWNGGRPPGVHSGKTLVGRHRGSIIRWGFRIPTDRRR